MDHTLEQPIVEELTRQLEAARRDLELLAIRSGRWLVWSCVVHPPTEALGKWNWVFDREFFTELPNWFDVNGLEDGRPGVILLDKARLGEDNPDCDDRAIRALESGAPGYSQMFRIRLRNGGVSWVEENVAIKRLPGGSFHAVGVCIDATRRKEDEARMQAMHEELMVQQEELLAQQEELMAQQEELLAQNEELQGLRQKLEREKKSLATANARLQGLVTTDGLTGVKNHRAFQEHLEAAWRAAERHGEPLSLVLLDIDCFKNFNDAFGHPAGDEVLKAVGRVLKDNARTTDCIARYGGEEFVVVLPHTDEAGATILADRFRTAIHKWTWQGSRITASFGVGERRAHMGGPQALIDAVDRALYQAKRDGRDCVRTVPRELGAAA